MEPIEDRIRPITVALFAEIAGAPDVEEQFAATCAVIAGLLSAQSDETVEIVFRSVREYRAAHAAAASKAAS